VKRGLAASINRMAKKASSASQETGEVGACSAAHGEKSVACDGRSDTAGV